MNREELQAVLIESAKAYVMEGAKTAAAALIAADGDPTRAIALVEEYAAPHDLEHDIRAAVQRGIHEADEEVRAA